jgi:hypothetical protein
MAFPMNQTNLGLRVSFNKRKREANPERQAVHAALTHWLTYPMRESSNAQLRAALSDYEVNARLRDLLPVVVNTTETPTAIHGAPSLPIEEVTFTNPAHRSTRLEFLADCSTHGV